MTTSWQPKYKQMYPWAAPNPKDVGSAICTWCSDKSFKIDTMGNSAFESHQAGKKHQSYKNVKQTSSTLKSFFTVKTSQTAGNFFDYKFILFLPDKIFQNIMKAFKELETSSLRLRLEISYCVLDAEIADPVTKEVDRHEIPIEIPERAVSSSCVLKKHLLNESVTNAEI